MNKTQRYEQIADEMEERASKVGERSSAHGVDRLRSSYAGARAQMALLEDQLKQLAAENDKLKRQVAEIEAAWDLTFAGTPAVPDAAS